MLHRLEVALKNELVDPIGNKVLKDFQSHGFQAESVRCIDAYLVDTDQIKDNKHLEQLTTELFVDPVLNHYSVNSLYADQLDFDWYVEVGFKAGVTDNAAKVAKENFELRLGQKLGDSEPVASTRAYVIKGNLSKAEIEQATADLLMNGLIQHHHIIAKKDWDAQKQSVISIPKPHGDESIQVDTMDCSTPQLVLDHSEERLLALSKEEAGVIAAYFSDPKTIALRKEAGLSEQPTDVELECLAQTWSEHCKHKIFNATVSYEDDEGNKEEIKSLYKSYIQGSTKEIRKQLGEDDWCLSVFKDNAGIIKFDKENSVAFKVETHNSPSALDPYGGALTGIVGVNRDSFGTGMGAQLIANTDVFCFGPPDYDGPLPKRLFHPSRIFEGVRQGVEHGGNHSGVPTVNGSIVFDDCFIGKPLVFCGTLSIMPAKHAGQPSEDKKANPGDHIVMVGGRIGKDGIHGATFSSMELDENSPVSAVQIGDPITQKRMFDFLWAAKEENLFSCITDNGAGGLSSSVGEMSEDSGGCVMHLDRAPLKYAGLQPWEILISEAQERMTLSVPPEKLARLLELSEEMLVESTELGTYTDTGFFECLYEGKSVCKLEMHFMHDGLPPMQIPAKWNRPEITIPTVKRTDYGTLLKELLARPNVCSKEAVIRQYDHEVGGASVIKPLMGLNNDAPNDSGVIRPVLGSMEGLILSNGICPKYSAIDAYHMAACAIDESIRNIIATGGSLEQVAGLDNFCWPDPVESAKTPDGQHKMAQLVRACKAIYDYCTGFGVPCISGKDSMKNDANLDGQKISILPTLLFSAVGKIKDVRKCITSDLKHAGELVYVIGDTYNELGAGELFNHLNITEGDVPKVDLETAKLRYNKVAQASDQGLISAMHDLSDGGLSTALAEMAFGGGFGMDLNLDSVMGKAELGALEVLFSESQSRFVASVSKENRASFEALLGTDITLLGTTTEAESLRICVEGTEILSESLSGLKSAWWDTLNQNA